MPPICSMLLLAVAATAAGQPNDNRYSADPSYGADPAAYQAAFGEPAEANRAPNADRQSEYARPATMRPAHLPVRFESGRARQGKTPAEGAVQQAAAYESPGPGQLAAPDRHRPIPLAPPSARQGSGVGGLPTASFPTVIISLGAVLGLFLIVALVMRRSLPKGSRGLPSEVVEVLGRAPLTGRQQMQLLRLGNKLVLVAVSQAGTDTIAEITDPQEVDRLTGLCFQAHPHSASATFRQVFKSFEAPETGRGGDRLDFSQLDALARSAAAKGGLHGR